MTANPAKDYDAALEEYLAGAGESALKDAYMIGRRALDQGLGVLDVAAAHHKALGRLLRRSDLSKNRSQNMVKQAGSFLAECLSPFEMAQRGFQDTIAALKSLTAQARQQAAVAGLGELALASTDHDKLIHEAMHLTAQILDVEFCEFLELLPDGDVLVLRDGVGWDNHIIGVLKVEARDDSQAGYTLLSATPVIVENLATETRFAPPDLLVECGVVSGMTVIISGQVQPYGILGVHTARRRRFVVEEISFLQSVANILAMAITNKRLLESEAHRRQAAEQANEQKLKVLAIVAHELRTPLSSIKGFATTLLADDVTWDASSQIDFIKTIDEEADKLSNLVGQLLDLSKMDIGGFHIRASEQPLTAIVSQVMGQLQALTCQHQLIITLPDRLPSVYADAERVGQVLANLVENAAKYSPHHTEITITAEADTSFVKISVSDEGPGIAPQEVSKVFELFYRTGTAVSSGAKGIGVGLTICQRLVEAQGGRIWIEEQAGPGATIVFTLPSAR